MLRSLGSTVPIESYRELHVQKAGEEHWAYYYARKVLAQTKGTGPIIIQTSMSPTGYFHIGNFRDTLCAYLVQRTLHKLGHKAHILLSFDDYDAFRKNAQTIENNTFDYSGFPLATATSHATEICQSYIQELKLLGICPQETDENGKTDVATSHWTTHYQYERYTSGQYNRRIYANLRDSRVLARLLGASDPKKLFVIYCRQCGRSHTTLLSLAPHRPRYLCQHCHALTTATDLSEIKPSWNLDWTLRVAHERIDCEPAGQDHCTAGSTMDRTKKVYSRYYRMRQPVIVPYGIVRQFADQAKISGSQGKGLRIGDLLCYLPPLMILWLYGRKNCLADMCINFSRPPMFAYYAEFDSFLQTVATSQKKRMLYELLCDLPLPAPRTNIPGFRFSVGLLNANFFDKEAVLEVLHEQGFTDCPGCKLSERVTHALQWIIQYDQKNTWLLTTKLTDEHISFHSKAIGGACNASFDLEGKLDRQAYAEIYWILFKTSSGPPLKKILTCFGKEQVEQAIQQFSHSQQRPLRQILLQRLEAKETPAQITVAKSMVSAERAL